MKIRFYLPIVVLLSLILVCCTANSDSKKAADLEISEFESLRKSGNVLVLDVRTSDEFNSGHIPGAVNIDYYSDDFEQKVQQLKAHDSVLVYCASGRRSAASAEVLKKAGFSYIGNLKGGYNKWSAQ